MKAGTTSFAALLDTHPQLRLACKKEVDYFDMNFELGVRWYKSHFPLRAPGQAKPLHFEATPYYLFHPEVPRRVAEFNPDLRLIVLLRDPIERSFSHYRHMVRTGKEPLSFEQAVAAEEARLEGELDRMRAGRLAPAGFGKGGSHKNHSYVARSEYETQLRAWMEQFPRSQLLVLKSEALFEDPSASLGRVAEFLRIEPFQSASLGHLNIGQSGSIDDQLAGRLRKVFSMSSAWIEQEFGICWP